MKIPVSSSVEEPDLKRIQRLVREDNSHDALIIRKAILAGLPELERDILGVAFVGGVRRKKEDISA